MSAISMLDRLLLEDRPSFECWVWDGGRTTAGYGTVRLNGKKTYVHRLVYELTVGPISEGLEIDHLCRNRACCNPAHLEAVTHQENMRRAGIYRRKTHCPSGHDITGDNGFDDGKGGRRCRTCKRASGLRYYHKTGRDRRRAAA